MATQSLWWPHGWQWWYLAAASFVLAAVQVWARREVRAMSTDDPHDPVEEADNARILATGDGEIAQPVTVDHGDLLEAIQAAEAWAGNLRARSRKTEAPDRIDAAIARLRRDSLATATRS